MPSATTLSIRSTRNVHGNCDPILVTVRSLYSILQLAVFGFCLFTLASTHPDDAVIQVSMPSVLTLLFRLTPNLRGNPGPILATVRLRRIL
jgi:hypothetical protein